MEREVKHESRMRTYVMNVTSGSVATRGMPLLSDKPETCGR